MRKFECEKCGSGKLAYQKYVKCVSPVEMDENNNMTYSKASIDEDDYLGVHYGFCCGECGTLISHCGVEMENEDYLISYLNLPEEQRAEQQKDYESYISSFIENQADEANSPICPESIS